VRELQALLGLHELPHEGAGRYHSTGGFVVAGLDRIPSVGDWFEHEGWRFEVVDMDGLRVDKVLARRAVTE
jgi:putative hemolysin